MKRFTVRLKLHIFICVILFFATFGTCIISYFINMYQTDNYFKRLSLSAARVASNFIDVDFIKELNTIAHSDEYLELRDIAETAEDEEIVIQYFKDIGIWEKYIEQRELLRKFVNNSSDITYLYIVNCDNSGQNYDMYLLDADDVEVYETGYLEEREAEFEFTDFSKEVEPVISNGDWGWLCSGYVPVYDGDELICQIGCDISMDDIIAARRETIAKLLSIAVIFMFIVMVFAVLIIQKNFVKPLNLIIQDMNKFTPAPKQTYEESNIIFLPEIKSNDEISDIYKEIRNMQIKIQEYVDNIANISINREQIENTLKNKNKAIGQMKELAYKDNLTNVSNLTAYSKKTEELNQLIKEGKTNFSIIMVDVNNLKTTNDNYGHDKGDLYLKGCCHLICEIFKHSPVFRIGGDEFVIIASNDDYTNRIERVQELRDAYINAFNNTNIDPWARYSAAIGMSDCTSEDTSVEQVFKRADNEMYEDKRRFKEQNK